MNKHLKIIHCGIFNEYQDGNFFYGLERKISHGLIQNGHFVYDFSYRDWEKNLRFLHMKNSGLKKMNDKLINICKNIQPNLLLLAKSEKIDISTLKTIKKIVPNIKISQWYVDHLEEKEEFFQKLNIVDTFFYANAKELKNLSKKYKNCTFSFFPNISDMAFDKSYELEKTNDIIYIASDHKEDIRTKFALKLQEFCQNNNIKVKIYASLGNNPIFGDNFHKAISSSKIGINFNRDDTIDRPNNTKLLGASDRMAQFLGCKICTFSPKIRGFEKLYTDKEEIVYFENAQDCFKKIKYYLKDDNYKQIAKNGQLKTYSLANSKRVTKFMLECMYLQNFTQTYQWQNHIYKSGERL